MDTNNLALSSLAMDLKRMALGLHQGSSVTATRFMEEARRRQQEVDCALLAPYMQMIIANLNRVFVNVTTDRTAEDALMYSQLIQNYVLKEQVQG